MNIISRRSFIERAALAGAGLGVASLTNIPFVMKRALAAGLGSNGKKLMFIWLRFGHDGLNAMIPQGDTNYNVIRSTIGIPYVAGNWTTAVPAGYTGGMPFVASGNTTGVYDGPYLNSSYPTGNGFANLHPSLKFLAPVYNHGDLALIHRVGYPRQSRSHFDSQNYWENAYPGNGLLKEGFLYRTAYASGLANLQPLTGVSVQSSLPLILQGDKAAMTNLSDPLRYDLLGIPNNANGNTKFGSSLSNAVNYPFPAKNYRDMLALQYGGMSQTLTTFANIDFTDNGNTYYDGPIGEAAFDAAHPHSDGDAAWYTNGNNKPGYWLFPHSNASNGGWQRDLSQPATGSNLQANKYVLSPSNTYYSFLKQVKAAALILNNTDAFIGGTELGGFDHHNDEIGTGPLTNDGVHYNHLRAVGQAFYALFKYFKIYGKNGTNPTPGAKCAWDDLVICAFTEFGRTSVQNATRGTDHGEGVLFFVAGGGVNGFVAPGNPHAVPNNTNGPTPNANGNSGIYCCSTSQSPKNGAQNVNWQVGPTFDISTSTNASQTGTGTLFNATGRYLQRAVDYRSIFGELIRDHLGASQSQLNTIISAYADETSNRLLNGGIVTTPVDSVATTTTGEVNIV